MGWTTCYTANHWKTAKGRPVVDRKAECDDLYTWQKKDKDGRVLSSTRVLKSTMRGSVYYAACETVKEGKANVWAAVCLTCGKSSWDGTIWGYKTISEDMEPYYYDCPTGILALLSPTDNAPSLRWREECRKRSGQKKAAKLLVLPKGVTAKYRGGWVISSPEYCANNYYSGVRYGKMTSKTDAITLFVNQYGTPDQKMEWRLTLAAAAA